MQRLIRLLLFPILLFLSCHEASPPTIENLNGNSIAIIGHGGCGYKSMFTYLPIDSRKSIYKAVDELLASGSEMDVQLSKDGKLILYHDELLEKSTDCTGKVNDMTASKLTNCRYSSNFFQFNTEKENIITLEEVLKTFSAKKKKPLITLDLKSHKRDGLTDSAYYELFSQSIVKLLKRFNYAEQTLIESPAIDMLLALKRWNPDLKLFIYPGDFESGFKAARENDLFGITINNKLINKQQVDLAHQNGLRVTIWGVGSTRSCNQAISKQPDYIQTDDITKLRALLDA